MIGARRSFTVVAACAALLAASCSSGGPTVVEDPMTFNIGQNNPGVIVAFGDSISYGVDSTDGTGYRDDLERFYDLEGRAYIKVLNEGVPGSYTLDGAARIGSVLERDEPAVLVLLYGTNDELKNLPRAAFEREVILPTTEYLRQIAVTARANKTIVVMSTLPPVCGIARVRQRENIELLNEKIRTLAAELGSRDWGVRFADAWDAFIERGAPDGCSLISMTSGNHPNDAGYAVLARIYHDALDGLTW